MSIDRPPLRADTGSTSVEFIALVPVLVALALGAWQGLVAAQVAWCSGTAAGAAARAQAIGGDPLVAARAAVPKQLRAGVRVRLVDRGVVVTVRVPAVVGRRSLTSFSSTAHLRDQAL